MRTVSAPVRLTRAESKARTRDLLITAAMRVFARDGYWGASVDTIAEQAGFTVGALYSNFATKQELFLAVLERHCELELRDLCALADAANDQQELLGAVTERFATLTDEQREWELLWVELWLYGQRHPEAAERMATVQRQTREVIAQALGCQGEPLDEELAGLVHALWGGFLMYRITDQQPLRPGAFARAVDCLLDGHRIKRQTRSKGAKQ
jgi:AcrR family transcriptional regulator